MGAFEIGVLLIGALTLLSTNILTFVRLKVDIAKIEVEIQNIRHELIQKELSLTRLEDRNSEQHKDILNKVDTILINIKK